jgi:hypothetical protein
MSVPQKVIHSKAGKYHSSLLPGLHQWYPIQYMPLLFQGSEPPFNYIAQARMTLVELILLTK